MGGAGKAPWFEAYDDAVSELHDFQEKWASPTAPSAEAPLRVATVALLLARAACAIGATRGLRDIDGCRLCCSPGSAFIGE